MANFPSSLHTKLTLLDNVDDVLATHPNTLSDELNAVQTKVGIDSSVVNTTHDYFLKHASGAYRTHTHDGSSDDGAKIPLTTGVTGVLPLANGGRGDVTIILKAIADDDTLTTGDGKVYFTIPEQLTGMNLISAKAHVYTVSSSGLPTIMIHNLTDTSDMLSVAITIDENEKDSSSAATGETVNTSEDDVVTGDEIRIDVDTAGTGTKGLEVRLTFDLP
jgi:hypothetical protein